MPNPDAQPMDEADSEFERLRDELLQVFEAGVERPLDDGDFDSLARRIFEFQLASNPVYGALCRARGVGVGSLTDWTGIPPVPTRAFKRFSLLSGPDDEIDVVFETSGTTRGKETRGRHPVRDLRLYHGSLLPTFSHHVLGLERNASRESRRERDARPRLISLLPHPDQAPRSSLSHMIGVVERELCRAGGGWFVDADLGLRTEELDRRVEKLSADGEPVLVAGTAFSFVHWLDALAASGRRFQLPPGSRVMETGGFKGLSRTVEREELHDSICHRLGVDRDDVVNEYGMTELLSQFYSRGGAPHRGPPWMRTRVLDPATLEPASEGEEGILCHYDLANLGSVTAVLTEDLGVAEGDGRFTLLGRASDAEPRGCSIAMDELLSAAAR